MTGTGAPEGHDFGTGRVTEAPESPVVTGRDGYRLKCTLNRPAALNALTPELLFALAVAVGDAGRDDDIRVVSVEGAGHKAFSAGFDIKVLAALDAEAHRGEPLETATEALVACPKPTIAVVRGYCVGAGLDLALSCDLRIAAEGSRFSVPAIKIGTVYRPQSIERIWRVLGPSTTKALFILGHEFSAEEALRVGIVEQVVPADQLEDSVRSWSAIPDKGVFASRAHKQIINAFSARTDLGESFWAPLDGLRQQSVQSKERQTALQDFTERSRHGN